MKRKLFFGLGTIIVGALTLAAVANGPYYAFPAWAQKLVCAPPATVRGSSCLRTGTAKLSLRLPAGHPFQNIEVPVPSYWSATTSATNSLEAWGVSFDGGDLFREAKQGVNANERSWCVHGGMNADT